MFHAGPWKASNGVLYAQWSVPGQWHGLPSSPDNLALQADAPTMVGLLAEAFAAIHTDTTEDADLRDRIDVLLNKHGVHGSRSRVDA